MRHVIAGKSDSYYLYLKEYKYSKSDARYMRSMPGLVSIAEDDTIVLLYGWWSKSWAKDFLREIAQVFPALNYELLDGPFGEAQRKDLQSENISSRYDILDIEENR